MDPYNIIALKRREEDLKRNADNAKNALSATHRAQWMEKQTVKKFTAADITAQQKREEEELKLLADQLLKARQERLRQLYEREFNEWESQLRARGLAIERGFD